MFWMGSQVLLPKDVFCVYQSEFGDCVRVGGGKTHLVGCQVLTRTIRNFLWRQCGSETWRPSQCSPPATVQQATAAGGDGKAEPGGRQARRKSSIPLLTSAGMGDSFSGAGLACLQNRRESDRQVPGNPRTGPGCVVLKEPIRVSLSGLFIWSWVTEKLGCYS